MSVTNFYKKGGSYYNATDNSKILNLSDLQTFSKAGGKEISAPVVPTAQVAINGAQYNTRESQLANFSNIKPVGNTLYGTPKIPEKISSDNIKTASIKTEPATDYKSAFDSYVASLSAGNDAQSKLYQQAIKENQTPSTIEDTVKTGQDNIMSLIDKTQTKSTRMAEEQAKLGINDQTKTLQDLNSQIASKKAAYDKLSTDNQGRAVMTSMIGGQESLIARQRAVELGGLSAMAQAAQGNIALAKSTAKDTVDMEFKPLEDALAKQLQQLEFSYKDLNREDKKRADQLSILLNQRKSELDTAKEEKNSINEVMLKAAQGGADSVTLSKILNSKTEAEAISNAGSFLQTKKTTGGNGTVSGGSGGITKQEISQIDNNLLAVVGQDGFVSPEDYDLAKKDWITLGGAPADFDKKFKNRRNPNNQYYNTTNSNPGESQDSSTDETKIKEYKDQGYSKEDIIDAGYDSQAVDNVFTESKSTLGKIVDWLTFWK